MARLAYALLFAAVALVAARELRQAQLSVADLPTELQNLNAQ